MVHTSVFNNSGLGFGRLWWLSFSFMFWTGRNILLQRTLSCNVARITTLVAHSSVRWWSLDGMLSTTFLGFSCFEEVALESSAKEGHYLGSRFDVSEGLNLK